VAAALVALVAYSFLQVGLYGALGPAAAGQAAAHLGVHLPWWAWALAAWAVITALGLARVDITGRVLGVLLSTEILVILAETVWGLAHPAGGRLSLAMLSPAALTSAGFGTVGVLAVVANSRSRVVAVAAAQGPGLLFGLGSAWLGQAAQWLFLTSLFAAALAFHNCVWRYIFALGREGVLPAVFGRTGANSIPKAASLAQSLTGLAVIVAYAAGGWPPMTNLFFWLGTTGGFGILVLLAVTAVAVIAFFARDPRGESAWARLVAPALAAILLGGLVVLAVLHYSTLLGVPAGSVAARALPGGYVLAAGIGLGWGLVLRVRRPHVYETVGLGAHAVTGQTAPTSQILS